jgi:peroxiredoxin
MRFSTTLVLASLLAGATAGTAPPPVPKSSSQRATFGEKFPLSTFDNLNQDAGGPARIDLVNVVGKKPVVLYSWTPGDPRSERVFQELQALTDELGPDKVVLFGVTRPPFGSTDTLPIRAKIQDLKIHVPVLHDSSYILFKSLEEEPGPYLSILDAEGRLRLANGVSLKQTIEYKMTLADAIRRVATTGQLGTYGKLLKYFPAVEMVGQKCPDFEAVELGGAAPRKFASMIAPDRVNVLVFWSVDCPHCRASLPKMNTWIKEHPEGVNVVSAAAISSEVTRTKTEEFCKANGFTFPTLVDQRSQIMMLYQVISTPTIMIIRPDGVVDSVYAGEFNFGTTVEAKKKELLKRT